MTTLSRVQAIPLNDYPDGTHMLPEANIQPQASSFYFELQRCTTLTPDIWSNETMQIDIKLELSADNGQSWKSLSGFRARGGIFVALQTGQEQTFSAQETSIGAGNQRRMRGSAIIAGGPIRTQGFYETRNGN